MPAGYTDGRGRSGRDSGTCDDQVRMIVPTNRQRTCLDEARCGPGEVAERLKAPHSKCGIGASPIGGSNPSLSASGTAKDAR